MKDWRGRSMTQKEWDQFDTEDLIGLPAEIVVDHNNTPDGKTYANLRLIKPDRSGNPLSPSGKFVREKDKLPF
jgi:hypothetical protein